MNKKLVPLIDSHCHIDFQEFDDDLDLVITRAEKAGIEKILTICTKVSNLAKVLEITSYYPNVYFAAGSHPLNKCEYDNFTRDELLALVSNPKMLGLGETGLDYFYSSENSDQQKNILNFI